MSPRPTVPVVCAAALLFCVSSLSAAPAFDQVEREAFNRAAVRLNLPLYWVADANGDGSINPAEVVGLLFHPTSPEWVESGRFTADFAQAYDRIVAWSAEPPLPAGLDATERERRRLVIRDLDQGRPMLVRSVLRDLASTDRDLVGHMLKVAALTDQLYARQIGAAALRDEVPADDPASQSLFRRNWGPECAGPETESNPACTAIPGAPKPVYGAYPAAWQSDPTFCARLATLPNAERLSDPFTVVRERDGQVVAIAVTEAYAEQTRAIAAELRKTAGGIDDPGEKALKTYLEAAAHGFETNDWVAADEAWAAMNTLNSRWYVRVGPDEVYRDPCGLKGGFHLTFARINKDSLEWQDKLAPHQQDMEVEVAALAGAPYAARTVTFHLPDFIDIVVNAGDDRSPFGGTIGQSLPNWGPVANEGRGRTVVMTNLYTDPDSQALRRRGAASLLDASSLAHVSDEGVPALLNIILHEAAHNLGPSHEYEVEGRTDREVFGGPLSSTIEELKAQSVGLWLIELLRSRGIIDHTLARRAYVDAIVWAMGHVSRGMYQGSDTTRPKHYSQLSAIQIGFLTEQGAIEWRPDVKAANGEDQGAFVLHLDRFPAAIEHLTRQVLGIKARGEREAAQALIRAYVEGETERHEIIAERLLRIPKASFVYAVEM